MAEKEARSLIESGDSKRKRNAVIRLREPAAARMGFFSGPLQVRINCAKSIGSLPAPY